MPNALCTHRLLDFNYLPFSFCEQILAILKDFVCALFCCYCFVNARISASPTMHSAPKQPQIGVPTWIPHLSLRPQANSIVATSKQLNWLRRFLWLQSHRKNRIRFGSLRFHLCIHQRPQIQIYIYTFIQNIGCRLS